MGLGALSGVGAIVTAVLVATKTTNLHSASFTLDGGYIMLICLLIVALGTGISGLCFRSGDGQLRRTGNILLGVGITFAVLSAGAGVVTGFGVVGKVPMNSGWVLVA